ncbi:MAG: filamentous hemagglutinin N-terminal domain-containing protein [Gammaproteobacteria bacterium]|nr:filamentous hemagglutinin N-terminal domain-containing protein [Gammaproteobacteria bacterium]
MYYMARNRKHRHSQYFSNKIGRLRRQAVSYLLCLLLAFQPLIMQAAEITAARNAAAAHQPGVESAGNGVPLVNIVRPNASGLSHNKYDRFNVGQPGAILNNSNQTLQRSQLGGLVQGNPNLSSSGPASVIVNEVISAKRSLLEGTLEVHGSRADVIVANPNGISCNGCGFINTPRVTLATARPELNSNGSLKSLLVEKGDINIGLNGANLDSVSAFELVSRKISIGGPVKVAGDLNLVAGRNSYAYQTGLITPLASDANEPGVAIDSSLLGGMYAGRIKIISTDRGAGVNTQGQMAANAHGMTLTADGKLVLGNVRAKRAIGATSKTQSIEVQRTLFADEAIVLEANDAVTLDDNALIASSGDVSLKADSVSLGNAALVASGTREDGAQSNVGNLSVEADRLDAGDGQLAAGDTLTVTASTINLDRAADGNTDVLRSLGGIALKAENVSAHNARVTALGALDLKSSSSLNLTGGLYSAAGHLFVEADDITSSAVLNSKSTVTLRGISGSVVNSGRMAGDAGTVVSAVTIVRNEGDLFSAKAVNITSLGASINTATGRIAGNEGVGFNAASVHNAGKVAAQGSELSVNTDGNVDNSGELGGASARLNVDGTLSNRGQLDVTHALALKGHNHTHSTALHNHAGGSIISGSGNYSVASFDNATVMTTRSGGLDIDVTGNLSNTGAIAAKTTGTIELDGNLANAGSIISEKALVIVGRSGGRLGTLSNSHNTALINGAERLTIKAATVTNAGEMGSVDGHVLAELSGDLTNTGVFYSGTSSIYKLDGHLSNTHADILAEAALTIRGLNAARATSIKNSSGNIEAISGDLTLAADTITNERTNLAFGTTSSTQTSTSGSTTTTVVTTRETLSQSSAASKLLAGGTITVDANTLNNHYSQIAANGNITVTANTANNTGRDLIETVDTTAVIQHSQRYCARRILGICISRKTRYWTTTSHNTTSSTYDSTFASIEAGGTLDADVSGYLNNDAVRGSAGPIGLSSGSRALNSAHVAGGSGPANLVNLDEFDVGITALLGRSALFDVAQQPHSPFLVETRSQFIDPSEFLGSDFFLNQAGGYNPDQTLRRFGDAYVETRLIFDQIFALTGQRYVGNATDTRGLVQSLYENAIDARQSLGLTLGVALTPAQVARLTQDITWLEARVVGGQSVWVPRVYLASSTLDNVNFASAQIKAGQANVQVATLFNSGDMTGHDGLNVTANDAVLSQGGGLFANADIVINGGKLFSNNSGTVSGDNVTIKADDILNDTAKTRDRRSNGFTDRNQLIARIQARGDLLLDAEGTIASTGGQFSSGGSTTLDARKAVALGALEIERLAKDEFKGGYDRRSSLTHRLVGIHAGEALTLDSGGDVTLRGVDTSSGKDTTITATGGIDIVAVQDQQSKDLKLDLKTSGLLGTETHIRRQSASTQTRGSDIEASGALTITAQKEGITVKASRLASEEQTTLLAEEGKIALLTETDSEFERDERREEDIFWWNESDQGYVRETIKPVEIEAGGGLTINAGAGLVVEYQKTGDLNASIDQLAQSPGLEWIGGLKNDPRVDWVEVQARFDTWDYENQGLTEAGAAFVSLVVGAVSGGALSTLSANLATGLGFATEGVVQAALQAGLNSLAKQATIALINNKGDLGAALETLGSSASLRSLATAMVATGLTVHISDVADIGTDLPKTASLADRVVRDIQRGLIRTTVNAGVSTAIEGGKLDANLIAALRMEAASVIGENAAQEIGIAVDDGHLNTAGQLIAHAALGCVVGAAASGDCGSGAAGGVVGETVGLITKARLADWLEKRAEDARSGEVSKEQLLQELNEYQDAGVNVARLVSGLAVAVAGGDVDTAALTGGNAAQNNALCGGLCIGVIAAIIGYTTYSGDGDPLEGLAVIESGDDPLGQAVAAGTSAAVEWSATEYPEQTAAVLDVVEATGEAIDATITYVDDATGNKVSRRWNEIPEHTRNQIKGGAKIASIFVPAGSIKALKQLRKTRKLPVEPKSARMPSGKSQLDHIFDPKKVNEGHIAPRTESSRKRAGRMFENVASDSNNKRPDLVTDPNKQKAGIEVFTKDQRNGQVWVETRNGVIQDAGVNRSGAYR